MRNVNFSLLLFVCYRLQNMVHLKEFQWDGRLYLSVVDSKDASLELESSFLIYRPLPRPKATQY